MSNYIALTLEFLLDPIMLTLDPRLDALALVVVSCATAPARSSYSLLRSSTLACFSPKRRGSILSLSLSFSPSILAIRFSNPGLGERTLNAGAGAARFAEEVKAAGVDRVDVAEEGCASTITGAETCLEEAAHVGRAKTLSLLSVKGASPDTERC